MAGGRWPVVGGRFIPACAGNAQPCRTPWKQSPVHPRVCGERRPRHHAHAQDAGSSPRVRGTLPKPSLDGTSGRFIPACAGNASWAAAPDRLRPVHPRVCGERVGGLTTSAAVGGSSPRVRGTPRPRARRADRDRFIPAYAGNAPAPPASAAPAPVHPRVCGERRSGRSGAMLATGSSPRVRGTRHAIRARRHGPRFIPACAGNARRRRASTATSTVHPRVCGERLCLQNESGTSYGSSPRVRGTHDRAHPARAVLRFIPACAGNARWLTLREARPSVHPRVCGERRQLRITDAGADGSSPRVRGTRAGADHRGRARRFIPACAGNARRRRRGPSPAPVHPRVCGERIAGGRDAVRDAGSSPRVRGTRNDRTDGYGGDWFIPACAGNAPPVPPPLRRPPVHPRVCGERVLGTMRVYPDLGSSPRVRGTLEPSATCPPPARFIPACAGNAPRPPPSPP